MKKAGDYFEHPDDGVDIVIFRTQNFAAADYQPLPIEFIADKKTFDEENIKATDRIIFPSLLVNFMGTSRNYPAIRDGSIALIPDEQVPMKYKVGSRVVQTKQKLIFVDVMSVQGASGSPIFLWPGPRVKHNTFAIGGTEALLLGVMHGFYPALPRELEAIVTTVTPAFSENSGVAIVFPSWRILEIIQSEVFQKRISELISQNGENKPEASVKTAT